MKRNLKYIIPLLVVAGTSATSCNNNGAVQHLKRETYGTKVEKLSSLDETFSNIETNQLATNNETSYYNIPNKGKLVTNFNVNITGNARIVQYPQTIFDFNDIKLGYNDQITTIWDIDSNYFNCTNKNGKSYFIRSEDSGESWIKYFNTEVGDKKYKINITDEVDSYGCFKNYLLYQMALSNGLMIEEGFNDPIGFGIDICGFYHHDEPANWRNYFIPGSFSTIEEISEMKIGEWIDLISSNKEVTDILPIVTEYTKNDNDASSLSLTNAIKVDKFDFSKAQDLVDIIKDATGLDDTIIADGSGTGKIDYFANYKNNWLHQFELTLELNKANLQIFVTSENISDAGSMYLSFKNVASNSYINETFEPNCGEYKIPDTSEYVFVE